MLPNLLFQLVCCVNVYSHGYFHKNVFIVLLRAPPTLLTSRERQDGGSKRPENVRQIRKESLAHAQKPLFVMVQWVCMDLYRTIATLTITGWTYGYYYKF